MNADINIDIGVQSRQRFLDEPFKPTRTWTNDFHWVTDLESYLDQTADIATNVFSYVVGSRAGGAITQTHIAIRLSNPTHPTPGAGVVILPKGHIDFALTDEEFTDADVLQDAIELHIGNLKNTAKY